MTTLIFPAQLIRDEEFLKVTVTAEVENFVVAAGIPSEFARRFAGRLLIRMEVRDSIGFPLEVSDDETEHLREVLLSKI